MLPTLHTASSYALLCELPSAKHISGKRRGVSKNYELTVDSSVGIEKSVKMILQYIKGHMTL